MEGFGVITGVLPLVNQSIVRAVCAPTAAVRRCARCAFALRVVACWSCVALPWPGSSAHGALTTSHGVGRPRPRPPILPPPQGDSPDTHKNLSPSLNPSPVTPGISASAIRLVAGPYHTCVIVSGGGVMCWGFNSNGQLGIGSTIDQTSPVTVEGASDNDYDSQYLLWPGPSPKAII
jgi:hypothetical protein